MPEHPGNVTNFRRTDTARTGLMTAVRQRSVEVMALLSGDRVLDVGCGTGCGIRALADRVRPGGMVHGVDYDVAMIAEAQRRAGVDGLDRCVSYHQANAAALPWPDAYFDACRSDRVMQHMLAPERAFSELLRVTKPGGRIVVIDGDWATLGIDPDEADAEVDAAGRRAHFLATLHSPNPVTGRCLRGLFVHHGLLDIELCVQPVFDGDSDADWCWQQSRTRESDVAGTFASANIVMVSGRKASAIA